MSNHPLRDFFNQWTHVMSYNPSKPATSEFYRLCDTMKWDRDDEDRQRARAQFQDALTKQFNYNYGKDENNLASWQLLCENLRIVPIPATLEGARAAVHGTHVNLVDLTEGYDGGRDIPIFTTEEQLSIYTKVEGRFFTKESAYAGGLLKYLLRNITAPGQPRPAWNSRGRGRGSRRGGKQ